MANNSGSQMSEWWVETKEEEAKSRRQHAHALQAVRLRGWRKILSLGMIGDVCAYWYAADDLFPEYKPTNVYYYDVVFQFLWFRWRVRNLQEKHLLSAHFVTFKK